MALKTLESVRGAQVMKTKQFGTFMAKCHPIVEELPASVNNHEVSSIAFATSILRALRRPLEEITGAADDVEARPTVEEECSAHRNAYESGQAFYDEAIGLQLDPKIVADAIKEESTFIRTLHVYHEVPASYLDMSGLKAIGTRWVYTNKSDAANPFVGPRFVARG